MEEGESSSRTTRSVVTGEVEGFRVVSDQDKKEKRKEYQVRRDTTKVYLFEEQFTRWRQLKSDLQLKTDKEVAALLLDTYFNRKQAVTLSEAETQTDTHQTSSSTTETLWTESPVLTSTPQFQHKRHGHVTSSKKRRRLSLESQVQHGETSTPGVASFDEERTQLASESEYIELLNMPSDTYRSNTTGFDAERTLSASESEDSDIEQPDMPSDINSFQDDFHDLENMSLEEEVYDTLIEGHDDEDDVHDSQADSDENDGGSSSGAQQSQVIRIVPADTPKQEFCLASTSIIFDLLHKLHGPMCKRTNCDREVDFESSFVGTCLVVHWSCSAGHFGGRWSAQPQCEGIRAGNLLLASAIPLSGNSFTKIGFLCKVMNLHFFSKNLYNQYQNLYIGPAVNDYWENLKDSAWKEREDKEVILSSDGRNDTPGHCAQYCTYTYAEMETKCILELNIVDVREVEGRKSPNMERVGFERGLDKLMGSRMKIKEVVTDGHLEIGALMKNAPKYKDVLHQRDIWHGAKNLAKKVISAANEKGNEDLAHWIASVRNHFWYCSRKCCGSTEDFKDLWIGLLHHVVDEHQWVINDGKGEGKCDHSVLTEEERSKPWLAKDSSAHKALRKIILHKRLLNEFHYYINFRHTGFLESFHNHLLMYCPKRLSYTMIGYKLRNQLAAIDFNKHRNREIAKTADGTCRYKHHYSKRTKVYSVVPILQPKEYDYIPELIVAIFDKRKATPGYVTQKLKLAADDPRRIATNIALQHKPLKEDLLLRHRSRFSN